MTGDTVLFHSKVGIPGDSQCDAAADGIGIDVLRCRLRRKQAAPGYGVQIEVLHSSVDYQFAAYFVDIAVLHRQTGYAVVAADAVQRKILDIAGQ